MSISILLLKLASLNSMGILPSIGTNTKAKFPTQRTKNRQSKKSTSEEFHQKMAALKIGRQMSLKTPCQSLTNYYPFQIFSLSLKILELISRMPKSLSYHSWIPFVTEKDVSHLILTHQSPCRQLSKKKTHSLTEEHQHQHLHGKFLQQL